MSIQLFNRPVSTDKQELLVQQLEALKELSLKLNPQGPNLGL